MKKINLRFSVLTLMLLVVAVIRFIPHPPNFAPIGAMALFGATYYSKRWLAYLFPIVTFWLTDIFINNVVYGEYFDHFVLMHHGAYWTYGGMLLIVLAGTLIIKKVTAGKVIAASLTASVIFFIVSNFGVWASATMYPHTLSGLMTCYTMGIPFFGNTIAGDLVYSGVMFGVFELAQHRFPALRISTTNAIV